MVVRCKTWYLLNGGLPPFPLVPKNKLLFGGVSNERGSKSLSWSNSFKRRPSSFVPTAGVFSKARGGIGGAKMTSRY